MSTPVHILLALTPDGRDIYERRRRGKPRYGITGRQVRQLMDSLEECGFSPSGPEVVEITKNMMHRGRRQYSTSVFMRMGKEKAEELSDDRAKVLVITDGDMFATRTHYVVGKAELDGRVAVVSIVRIRAGNEWRFMARLEKEVLHELGHTLGLSHCRNRGCVMYSSKILSDSDLKSQEFCDRCRTKVGRALRPEG